MGRGPDAAQTGRYRTTKKRVKRRTDWLYLRYLVEKETGLPVGRMTWCRFLGYARCIRKSNACMDRTRSLEVDHEEEQHSRKYHL